MLSIITTVYNERENLPILAKRLYRVLAKVMRIKYELIFVNDGSTDDSLEVLLKLKKKYGNIKIISFNYNCGQTAAMRRGIEVAKGEIIVTIDADLQNFPEDIPLLVNKIKKGYDVVCGWRYKRKDKLFSKRLPSILSNFLVRRITKLRIHDSGCSLRAYRQKAIRNIPLFSETHRFIPLILFESRLRITEVKVRHKKRIYGKTKYGSKRYFKGFLDLLFILFLTRYSKRPFHILGLIGLTTIIFGLILLLLDLIYLLYFLKIPLLEINIGPMLFISLLMCFFGLNFIILGLISEILFHSYNKQIKEEIY